MGSGVASVLFVALGGAIGGMGRFAVSNLLARQFGTHFPWGTFAVNISGAFAAGWLLGILGLPSGQIPTSLWLLTVVGALGGYTTVSSFSLQTLALWQSGYPQRAIANVLGTCLLGFAMVSLGWWLGERL